VRLSRLGASCARVRHSRAFFRKVSEISITPTPHQSVPQLTISRYLAIMRPRMGFYEVLHCAAAGAANLVGDAVPMVTKILPSPICPVLAASVIASTTRSARSAEPQARCGIWAGNAPRIRRRDRFPCDPADGRNLDLGDGHPMHADRRERVAHHPQAWLGDVLARIADHKITDLAALLPWNWRRAARVDAAA